MRKSIFKRLYNQLFNKKELQTRDSALYKHISNISPLITNSHLQLSDNLDLDLVNAAERELEVILSKNFH